MTAIVLFLLAFSYAGILPDKPAQKQAEYQARYYLSQIEEGENVAENLWALSMLGANNAHTEKYIEQIVSGNYPVNNLINKIFAEFAPDYSTQLKKATLAHGSPDLLIAYLLTENDPAKRSSLLEKYYASYSLPSDPLPYKNLVQAIHKEQRITDNLLPTNRYYFLHSIILFHGKASKFINRQYLNSITTNWIPQNPPSNTTSLVNALYFATCFRALYATSKLSQISSVYPFLIRNNLFPYSLTKLSIYRFLDYAMYKLGYYNRSLKIIRRFTLPLADYLKKEKATLSIKTLKGVYLYSIGKLNRAAKVYQNVLAESKEKNISINFSSLYNNLALTYYKLGKYDQYLGLQFQALELAQKTNNYSHQLEILNNLFIYYRRNNNKKNALLYLTEAQKIAQKRNLEEVGSIYISLASAYRQFDSNYKKAHEYFTKAEKILDPRNNSEYFIYLLIEQAKTYEEQGKFSKALEKYNQIISITKKQKNPSYLDALVNKAQVYLKAGNEFQAKRFISKFKKYDLSQLSFVDLVKAKTVEADYLYQNGYVEKALTLLWPVLDQVVERARNSADLKTGFWHVADEYLNAFELAVSIYIDEDRPKKAVELLDRLKTINDASLYQSPLVRASMLNEKELTQYKRLTAQLDNARKKLLAAPTDERFEIQQTISRLKLKKDALDKQLTDQADVPPISVDEVQTNLSAYELVLHITELKDKYYVARIFRSKVSLEIIPLDSTLRNLFERSIREIANNKTNLNSLYAITNVLELQNIPEPIEKITVIPDSYLYQLPLAILPLKKPVSNYSYGGTDYLIESYVTRYLTSLNDYQTVAGDPAGSDYELNFAAYGVSNFENYTKRPLTPLPFAKAEVSAIANRLTNLEGKRIFVNNESTKEAFKRTAPDARILHLATHSKVSERDPLFSTFYMSKTGTHPDSAYQDQIFAYELFELKLNNEMIMLNSCESGSGSYLQGTGVMGISRALQYAGANSLVLNLWPVNDMLAADFAVYFYSQLNKGKSKAAAIRATKLYFLENKNASPHFWGPYLLIGNAKPIVHPNREMNLVIAGGFSLYFLLMAGLVLFKKMKGRKR
ncbi:MAG TPA: CHAT domain-containing tetratricopeptide repeat protein [Balneolaceae bacterium]